MKRSYKQNCALANALDLVGERWTLLIVRELLTGPRRYGELLENLPGMGTNLLATRLKEMTSMELVSKAGDRYQLTSRGTALEDVIHALIRFALPLNLPARQGALHRPAWDAVALAALYRADLAGGLDGIFELVLDRVPFQVAIDSGKVAIRQRPAERASTRVALTKETARSLAVGEMSFSAAMDQELVCINGDEKDARNLLSAFGILLH